MTLGQRMALITSGIFVVLLCITFFIVIPSVRYISTITTDINRTNSELEDQYQKIRLLKKSISELSTIQQETNLLKETTITKGDELTVIRELESIASDTGVSQNMGVSFVEKGKDAKRDHYVFTFKTRGDIASLVAYINRIEHIPYYMIIDSLTIAKPEKQIADAAHDLLLSFEATVYSSN